MCCNFREMLQAEGIAVSLAVMIDPPQISPPVPLNIERCINIFLSKDVLGGSHIKPAKGLSRSLCKLRSLAA